MNPVRPHDASEFFLVPINVTITKKINNYIRFFKV